MLSIYMAFFGGHNGRMEWNQKIWERNADKLPDFLEPLVAELGRSERRTGATLYVGGLLLPGERKSIEPMAERLGTDSQKLQQFVADSPWDEQTVWRRIRQEVVPVMEPLTYGLNGSPVCAWTSGEILQPPSNQSSGPWKLV